MGFTDDEFEPPQAAKKAPAPTAADRPKNFRRLRRIGGFTLTIVRRGWRGI